ncbi:hypothetical protein GOBAR_DD31423 [Gossypium barbadense]|nr:hypothetical protein GOBAR_DD31423 [Gossypium barbadense]
MRAFSSVLEDCSLEDLGYKGVCIGFRISRILSPTIAQLLWIQMMVFLVVVSGTFGLKRLGYWRIVVNERSLDFGEFRLEVFWKDLILALYLTDDVLMELVDVKLAMNLEADKDELYWE